MSDAAEGRGTPLTRVYVHTTLHTIKRIVRTYVLRTVLYSSSSIADRQISTHDVRLSRGGRHE